MENAVETLKQVKAMNLSIRGNSCYSWLNILRSKKQIREFGANLSCFSLLKNRGREERSHSWKFVIFMAKYFAKQKQIREFVANPICGANLSWLMCCLRAEAQTENTKFIRYAHSIKMS